MSTTKEQNQSTTKTDDPFKIACLRQVEALQEVLKYETNKERIDYYTKHLDWLQQQLKTMQEGDL